MPHAKMTGFQREMKFDSLNRMADEMDRKARHAIQWLEKDPNPDEAIKALSAWNLSQSQFWSYLIKMLRAESLGIDYFELGRGNYE